MHLSCWTVVFIFTITKSQFIGDSCILQSEEKGECNLISKCPSAIKNLQSGIRPKHCGFQGSEPIICCLKYNSYEAGLKSKRKCKEYVERAKIPDPLSIINGAPAKVGEFPHMVALGYGGVNDKQWLCGGSLVSEKFVLTAAHCVESPSSGLVKWAKMGTINLKSPRAGEFPQDYEIVNRIHHPDYKPPSVYNDIAILELNKSIYFTEGVHPACINTEFITPKKLEAVGWGRLQFSGSTSNNLMKVDLVQYSNDVCKMRFANLSNRTLAKGIDDETQVCAGGGYRESKDTCQGDSGGPLHVVELKDEIAKIYKIIGVTSFGKGCGVANVPGIYTRVSHFVPWIENIVWPEE